MLLQPVPPFRTASHIQRFEILRRHYRSQPCSAIVFDDIHDRILSRPLPVAFFFRTRRTARAVASGDSLVRFEWVSIQSESQPALVQRTWRFHERMGVANILAELRREREQVEQAIRSLERLARSRGQKLGRPPASMTGVPFKRRGRLPGSKNKIPNSDSTSRSAVNLFSKLSPWRGRDWKAGNPPLRWAV